MYEIISFISTIFEIIKDIKVLWIYIITNYKSFHTQSSVYVTFPAIYSTIGRDLPIKNPYIFVVKRGNKYIPLNLNLYPNKSIIIDSDAMNYINTGKFAKSHQLVFEGIVNSANVCLPESMFDVKVIDITLWN